MSKLKSLGLDKNTIVVFTSEHGRMMGKFGIVPKRFMYDASSRIPLIIKAPGYKAKKVPYPVSQIDIVPTLLKLFGKTAFWVKAGDTYATFLRKGEAETFAAANSGDLLTFEEAVAEFTIDS